MQSKEHQMLSTMFCTRSFDRENVLMFFNSFTWTSECYDSEKTAVSKEIIWRTWRCTFCTNDVGESSVSSPYRVQIVSRRMKKSWHLTKCSLDWFLMQSKEHQMLSAMFCARSRDRENALMFFNSFTWTAECYDSEKTASSTKMIRRTWRCMFCTKDVGVSSVSSPYRVQIVSRSMKKSWYLANSRRYNIHRALRNLKGDEHDQPFLWAQRGLKGLSVLQFSCHSPVIWLGHMATRTRFEVPFEENTAGGDSWSTQSRR